MQDDAIASQIELRPNLLDTLRGTPGGGVRQPFVGNQARDMLEFVVRRRRIERPSEASDEGVFPKAPENFRIPLVGANHQISVGLQIAGHPPDGLLEPQIFRQMIADRCEAGPDAHGRRISPRLFGRLLHSAYAARGGFVREERMEHDRIECAATECQGVGAERREGHRNMLVVVRPHREERIFSGRAVMSDDDFAPPYSTHQTHKIFDFGGLDMRKAVGVEHQRNAATQPEGETAARQTVHRHRVRRGDHRMAGVVIRGRGGDADLIGHGARSARERRRFLDVEALRNESRAQTERFGLLNLVDQIARRAWRACQGVETELVHPVHRVLHP